MAAQIRAWATELGFQQLGIADIELGEHEAYLQKWLDAGYHGSMDYMARHGSKRARPQELVPGTCRVISVRMDYLAADTRPLEVLAAPDKAYISRYALGRDYHKLIRKRLATLAGRIGQLAGGGQYRAFVDSAPVLERAIAERAGMGWIAKNTMLINADAGSWFFLGEIYTDLPLPADTPQATQALRHLYRLPGHLPHQCLHRPLPAGCAQMYFLPDHRAQGFDRPGPAAVDGQPRFRL